MSKPTAAPLSVRVLVALSNLHRRMLGVYFALLGPAATYTLVAWLARALYALQPSLRSRSEAHCRAALGDQLPPERVRRLAARSFVHRMWNIADLILAKRFLHPGTLDRVGGRLPEPHLSDLLAAQRRGKPVILVSAYYGPFDLWPILLGYNGVPAAVVYRPHANLVYDAFRERVRARGGCELVPLHAALQRLPQVLAGGGTVALVADHHVRGRAVPVRFLGLPTRVPRTVALLAWRYEADVVVAGLRRVHGAFRFEVVVSDVIRPPDWHAESDAIAYITVRYVRGLEAIIRRDPEQYVWAYARWGEELTSQLTQSAPPAE